MSLRKERGVWAVSTAAKVVAILVVGPVLAGVHALGQSSQAPTNSLPNPYRAVETWAQLGRPWGIHVRG